MHRRWEGNHQRLEWDALDHPTPKTFAPDLPLPSAHPHLLKHNQTQTHAHIHMHTHAAVTACVCCMMRSLFMLHDASHDIYRFTLNAPPPCSRWFGCRARRCSRRSTAHRHTYSSSPPTGRGHRRQTPCLCSTLPPKRRRRKRISLPTAGQKRQAVFFWPGHRGFPGGCRNPEP